MIKNNCAFKLTVHVYQIALTVPFKNIFLQIRRVFKIKLLIKCRNTKQFVIQNSNPKK